MTAALLERPTGFVKAPKVLEPSVSLIKPSGKVIRVQPNGLYLAKAIGFNEDGSEKMFSEGLLVPKVSGGALSVHAYINGYLNAFAKTINYTSDALKVGLSTSTYVPAQTHNHYSDITNEVANGNGYATGGVALGSPTSVVSGSVHTLSAASVSWTSSGSGFSAAFAWGYDTTPGTSATDPLIFYVDLGGTQTVSGGTVLQINWNASGILQATAS